MPSDPGSVGTAASALTSAAGTLAILAGVPSGVGSADGTGSAARFDSPGGVAVDGSGNVYVADSGNCTIRKITPAGVVSTFAGTAGQCGSADGTGSAARFRWPSGIAVDVAGNVYVSDTWNDTIRKITSAGVVTTLAGSPGQYGSVDGAGAEARFRQPSGIAVDGSGNVYVADASNNTIRKITPAGAVTTLAGAAGQSGSIDGTGSDAWFYHPSGVAVDGSGNVYVADTYNYSIRKVTAAGVVTTLAGAWFTYPYDVAVDGSGNIYVADYSIIRKVTPTGVVTLAGSWAGAADGTGSAAQFDDPQGVAVDGSGNVYVADTDNHTIRKVTAAGVVTTLAGSAGQRGLANGTGSAARFYDPYGVAVDGSGNIYVADMNAHTIRKVTTAGDVTTFAGSGWYGYADGNASEARFEVPYGVAVDGSGNVYVADENCTIRKITSLGEVSTLAGSPWQRGSADGTGTAAQFDHPHGVAVDASGNVYVADTYNRTIRKITPAGAVTTLAGSAGELYEPEGVAVDALGNVYVADYYTIRKVTPAGAVTALAGGSWGYSDGTGSKAQFSYLQGLAVDRSRNVYVADGYNNTIRKVTPSGVVSTVVGAPGWTVGNFPGPLPASLVSPRGVAVDQETGNLFITVDSAVLVASNDLAISPKATTASPGGHLTFTASGGSGGYTFSFSTSNSGASITPAGAYSAGSAEGATDTVKVTDSSGASATATVIVQTPAALTISPTNATVAAGDHQTFTASGGSGSYSWSVSTNSSGASITPAGAYTAGGTGGVADAVTVTDSHGASATATVTVMTPSSGSKSGGGCGSGHGGMMSLVGLLLAGIVRRRR